MMDIYEVMKQRHSVRQYEEKKIEPDKRALLLEEIDKINKEGHLHIQIHPIRRSGFCPCVRVQYQKGTWKIWKSDIFHTRSDEFIHQDRPWHCQISF